MATTTTTTTVRVFYSNDPSYEVGVPVRFWVTDLGRIFKAEDADAIMAFVASGKAGYGPWGHSAGEPLDGDWQTITPEQTRRCAGCHTTYLATALSPGGYCAGCAIKWNPCRVCGADRLHGLHTDDEYATRGMLRPTSGYYSPAWMPGDPAI